MRRVTGIGGIFFKARDPDTLREWYRRHLGIDVAEWGGAAFHWHDGRHPDGSGTTVWSIFEATTDYFSPGGASFMINYRVEDLEALLTALRAEGCDVDDRIDRSEQGAFGWVIDPEGNRIELWQPAEGQ